MNIDVLSYASATVAYFILTGLAIATWQRKLVGFILILAGLVSFLWALQLTLITQIQAAPTSLMLLCEFLRVVTWQYFLWYVARNRSNSTEYRKVSDKLLWVVISSNLLLFFSNILALTIGPGSITSLLNVSNIPKLSWILSSVVSILLLEQLFRSTPEKQRNNIKQICFGLGVIFLLDFYLYSDTLLLKHLNEHVWSARGFINALAVPLIAVSAARNPGWALDIHVSRSVVVQSFTLAAAGVYLLLLSTISYSIQYYGNDWGETLQFVVIFTGIASLIAVIASSRIKAHLNLFLSKNFFSHKYDYRTIWLDFTDTLSNEKIEIPDRIVQALCNLVESPSGALWVLKSGREYTQLATTNTECPPVFQTLDFGGITEVNSDNFSIVELDDNFSETLAPEHANPGLQFTSSGKPWLLVALKFQDTIIGIVVIDKSKIIDKIDWEERDLLAAASFQAAGLLKQYLGNLELIDAKQFEAFNRLSAYVVHDLKNILNQQKLIVSNAERHKHNPDFIDDVIDTIDNSVQRMTVLMAQLRTGLRAEEDSVVNLADLLESVVGKTSIRAPIPEFSKTSTEMCVVASYTKLSEVFSHLIQNAQEATPDNGTILVRLSSDADSAIITIQDNGAGMTADFIRHRLFKAFDTTKGLTGMGIGVFESREYLGSLGGNIDVLSKISQGTTFTLSIPLHTSSTG